MKEKIVIWAALAGLCGLAAAVGYGWLAVFIALVTCDAPFAEWGAVEFFMLFVIVFAPAGIAYVLVREYRIAGRGK